MADNPFKRPDESGFLDNDPFAELMRMADAPRPAAQEPAFAANESFDIDLERELLGDFDEPDQAPVATTVADHWSREPEYEPEPTEAEPAIEAHAFDEPHFDEPEFDHSQLDEPVAPSALDDLDMAFELDMSDEGPHLPLSAADAAAEPIASFEAEEDVPEDFDARSHALFASVPELAEDVAVEEPEADDFDRAFADFDLAGEPEVEFGGTQQLVADPISFDEMNDDRDPFPEPAAPHFAAAEPDLEAFSDDDFDFDPDLEIASEEPADADEPVIGHTVSWPSDEVFASTPVDVDTSDYVSHDDVLAQDDHPIFDEPEASNEAPAFSHDDVLQAGPAADHEEQSEYAQNLELAHDEEPAPAWAPLDLRTEGPVESVSIPTASELSSPFEPQLRREIADDDDVLNDIESWLGADIEPEPTSSQAHVSPFVAPVQHAEIAAAPAPVASEPEPLSLEDELSALLGGDEPAPALSAVDAAPNWQQPETLEAQSTIEPDLDFTNDEIDLALDLEFDEPELHGAEADTFDLSELETEGWQDEDVPGAFEPEATDSFDETPVPAYATSATNEHEPVVTKKTGPLAMLAALAPAAMARFGGGDKSSSSRPVEAPQPATPLFGMARANRPVAPEIETVDVDDQPVAMVDDLEIPELAEQEEVTPLFSPDDLEAELDVAFGSLATDDENPTAQPTPATSAVPEQVPLQGYFVDGDYAYTPEQNTQSGAGEFGDVDFDDDPDADFEVQQPAPKDGLRRKYFILGGVAAVAIIGGLGYFAVGGPIGNGTPVVVRADSEPVRVRPENRGGATVPNQNSQAYQRATGATGVPGGGQEQLVTSAEEPMDVRAAVTPSEPMNDFPLVGMEEIPMLDEAEATNMLASVKNDERLGSVEDIIEEDSIEIAPRRVRTMVVRPDGTLVPRDEVPAAATRAELEATTIAAAAGQGTAVPLVQDAQPIGTIVPPSEVLADDPVMPDTVGVVPSRPQASAAPAAQPAPVQVAAAAPSTQPPVAQSASAAPAVGEWSMQIASQPTAEGAQSAYQDLARRYGSVLEGKGVNIVRADIDGMGTFYRVRIPAATRDEAIGLCESFKGAGGNCFVSR